MSDFHVRYLHPPKLCVLDSVSDPKTLGITCLVGNAMKPFFVHVRISIRPKNCFRITVFLQRL
jgi:hypothetical protein